MQQNTVHNIGTNDLPRQDLTKNLFYQEWKNMLAFSLDFPDIKVCEEWLKASKFIDWLVKQGEINNIVFMPCENECKEWNSSTCKYLVFDNEIVKDKQFSGLSKIEQRNEDVALENATKEIWD